MKRVICLSALCFFVFGVAGVSLAMDGCDGKTCSTPGQTGGAAAGDKKAVDAGNTVCPVTGEKIEEGKKVTSEYKGTVYNFCCSGCPDEFKKDPEKYTKKIEEGKAK